MLPSIKGFTLAAALLASTGALAAPSADDILRQARDRDDGKSFMSQVSLILVDKQGNTRVREFAYLQKDYADSDKFTMHFESPSDVRDVAFHIENPREALGLEDSQWMYLPVSRQTRRISTTDKRGSFMGSDFSYADLDKIRVGDYRQTLVGEEVIEGRECYVIERRPASEQVLAKTGYDRLQVWIDKQNHLVMRQDYFDVRGVMTKQLYTRKVETIDGVDSILLSEVQHLVNGTRSQLRFNKLQYNVELDDRLFTQTSIRRGLKAGDTPDFRVSAR